MGEVIIERCYRICSMHFTTPAHAKKFPVGIAIYFA